MVVVAAIVVVIVVVVVVVICKSQMHITRYTHPFTDSAIYCTFGLK